MEDFKLEFYFSLYKDKPISTREEFRVKFKRLHGEYEDIEILLMKIENYQIEKYGTTLYDWSKNRDKEQAYINQMCNEAIEIGRKKKR